ncbi:hypothetical protein OAE72_02620 [Akkermansiaceae bacterium]|nr:hypothetical protein [Akkermansiaceae bacterium]
MTYPLGSFPRYGHQQRWADERRQRAITNSILTRQANAEAHLNTEMAFCQELLKQATTFRANNDEGERNIAEFYKKMNRIQRIHAKGKRVYYQRLIDLLLWVCEICGQYPELKHKDKEFMVALIEDTAFRYEQGQA